MMKRISIFTTALFLGSATMYAFSGQGSGTEKDPYLVTNADELFEVRNDLSACYKQINDIDLSEWIYEESPNMGWMPIGTSTSPFSGTYDGCNYAIKNLIINRPNQSGVALFGCIEEAIIKHVCIVNPLIIGGDATAALIGQTKTNSNFKFENNTIIGGSITSNAITAGIVALCPCIRTDKITSVISGNYVSTTLTGEIVGGICGKTSGYHYYSSKYFYTDYSIVSVEDNFFDGNIYSSNIASGIVGDIPYYLFTSYDANVKINRNISKGTFIASNNLYGIVYDELNRYIEITCNISLADTLCVYDSNDVNKVCNNIISDNNYSYSGTVVIIKGKNTMLEDNGANGIGYGKNTLMRQSTYEGIGMDFFNLWAINEGESFPYFSRQSKQPEDLTFICGNKSYISGKAEGNGKVYVFVNETMYESNVVDGEWCCQLGNIPEETEAKVFYQRHNMAPSAYIRIHSKKDNTIPDVVVGDSNGDGLVDAADVVSTVNSILGKPSSSFNEKNADVTGDGQILVDDAVTTINIIIKNQ